MSTRKNPAAVALGRRGGKASGQVRSEAKAAAARLNGAKGGRPRQAATVNTVNAELRRRGFAERLVRGRAVGVTSYYYFVDGAAMTWPTSTVGGVSHVEALTVAQWLEARAELAAARSGANPKDERDA